MKYHLLSAMLILAAVVLLSGIAVTGSSLIGPLLIVGAAICEVPFLEAAISPSPSDCEAVGESASRIPVQIGKLRRHACPRNCTIVAARDRNASALFISEVLALGPPVVLGSFALITVGAGLTLDFVDSRDEKLVPDRVRFSTPT